MTLPIPQIDPIELSRWQGKVDANLTSLDVRIHSLEVIIEALPDRIERRVEKVITQSNERHITFQWVMEKIALPLLLSGGSAGLAVYAIMKSTGLH